MKTFAILTGILAIMAPLVASLKVFENPTDAELMRQLEARECCTVSLTLTQPISAHAPSPLLIGCRFVCSRAGLARPAAAKLTVELNLVSLTVVQCILKR